MKMKKLAFATLVAMGVSAVAIAQQPSQQPAPRSTQPQTQPAPRGDDRTDQVTFERADKNADGRINREEANDIDGFDFSRADTNNDASLSRSEYQAAMSTSTPRERDGAAARDDSGSTRGGEASASARSGQAGASAQAGGSAQSGQPSRERSDDEVAVQPRGGQQRAQVTFDTADKNKDGKVTREEATDVPNLNFTSADINADASLSRQEFQTAMAGAQPRG